MTVVRLVLVAIVVALATWFLGWWAVPLIGAAYGVVRPAGDTVVTEAATGAMLAWAGLLAFQASNPAFSRLTASVSGVFPFPTVVLLAVTVAFAGLLAGSAARVTRKR